MKTSIEATLKWVKKFNKIRTVVKTISEKIKEAEEVTTKKLYKKWRKNDKIKDVIIRSHSAKMNTKSYPDNVLRDAYIRIAEHPVVADFFRNTEKSEVNKRRRIVQKLARLKMLKELGLQKIT